MNKNDLNKCPCCGQTAVLVKVNNMVGYMCRDCAAEHERRVQRIAANTATTKGR